LHYLSGKTDLVTGGGDRAQRIKAIVGASSGNLVEWYDFYAYAFTSIYFAAAFFPTGDATSQLMATAGIFAVGFFMRPLGAGCSAGSPTRMDARTPW
jgi:MHS family alpha-ketoglutarate permease-like MFS transporter